MRAQLAPFQPAGTLKEPQLSNSVLSIRLMLSPLLPETAVLMEGARGMSTGHQTLTTSRCVNVRLCPSPFHSRLTLAKQTSGGSQECAGGISSHPPFPLHHTLPALTTSQSPHLHTCCPLPASSFKEVRAPKKSKALGQPLEATVGLLSLLRESLCKEKLTKRRAKRKGGYDNRKAEGSISSPDTGKLVLKVTCS